eukprot:gene17809-biopygen22946
MPHRAGGGLQVVCGEGGVVSCFWTAPDYSLLFEDKEIGRIRELRSLVVKEIRCGVGNQCGTGAAAAFNEPLGVAYSPDGATVAIADKLNQRIRLVAAATGAVTTLAGSGADAFADGTGAAAAFNKVLGVTYHGRVSRHPWSVSPPLRSSGDLVFGVQPALRSPGGTRDTTTVLPRRGNRRRRRWTKSPHPPGGRGDGRGDHPRGQRDPVHSHGDPVAPAECLAMRERPGGIHPLPYSARNV